MKIDATDREGRKSVIENTEEQGSALAAQPSIKNQRVNMDSPQVMLATERVTKVQESMRAQRDPAANQVVESEITRVAKKSKETDDATQPASK